MQPAFSWQTWAGLSAVFAALTAILAKLGVGGINSNFATLDPDCLYPHPRRDHRFRHAGMAGAEFDFTAKLPVSGVVGFGDGRLVALLFSRRFNWARLPKSRRSINLSVVLVALFGVTFLGEKLSAMNWLGVIFVGAGAILLAFKF